jgi:beta-lactamase regulating signal transducer with metallopeptidase domain
MRKRTAIRVVLAVIGFITLASLLLKPIPPVKARASRISGVNSVRGVTLTLTNTNAVTRGQPNSGR